MKLGFMMGACAGSCLFVGVVLISGVSPAFAGPPTVSVPVSADGHGTVVTTYLCYGGSDGPGQISNPSKDPEVAKAQIAAAPTACKQMYSPGSNDPEKGAAPTANTISTDKKNGVLNVVDDADIDYNVASKDDGAKTVTVVLGLIGKGANADKSKSLKTTTVFRCLTPDAPGEIISGASSDPRVARKQIEISKSICSEKGQVKNSCRILGRDDGVKAASGAEIPAKRAEIFRLAKAAADSATPSAECREDGYKEAFAGAYAGTLMARKDRARPCKALGLNDGWNAARTLKFSCDQISKTASEAFGTLSLPEFHSDRCTGTEEEYRNGYEVAFKARFTKLRDDKCKTADAAVTGDEIIKSAPNSGDGAPGVQPPKKGKFKKLE